MSLMMFPPKLLQWLGNDPKHGMVLSTLPAGIWFCSLNVAGKDDTVAQGTARTPGEAIIKCWENYLSISN